MKTPPSLQLKKKNESISIVTKRGVEGDRHKAVRHGIRLGTKGVDLCSWDKKRGAFAVAEKGKTDKERRQLALLPGEADRLEAEDRQDLRGPPRRIRATKINAAPHEVQKGGKGVCGREWRANLLKGGVEREMESGREPEPVLRTFGKNGKKHRRILRPGAAMSQWKEGELVGGMGEIGKKEPLRAPFMERVTQCQ